MKKSLSLLVSLLLLITVGLCFPTSALSEVEWETLKNVTLDDVPKDIIVSGDGTTAYILCANNILIYSVPENRVTGTIPLGGDFSGIALSPMGDRLFLTDAKTKQLSIISISQVFDIPIGNSPIIGKIGATVSVYAFLDFQ